MRWALVAVVVSACSSGASSGPPVAVARDAQADVAPAHRASDALRRCATAGGALASIADAVARLNALPAPADGPCFIATLPRPLAVVATTGIFSAQPAAGSSSPRLFFLLPKLVVSAVPAGDGSKVLELGEWTTSSRTVKGEVALPVASPLAPDAPFTRVDRGNGRSSCGMCHRGEEPHPSIARAFVSAAFKPERGTEVSLAELRRMHDACEADAGDRCAMFHALFDFGEVTAGAFADEVETFN